MGLNVNLHGGPSVTLGSMGSDQAFTEARFLAHETLREGQQKMIQDGLNVLEKDGFLLSNAPTGIGKTAAALSSALTVARSREGPSHILFMTGRQSQHHIVVDTVRRINSRLAPEEKKVSLVDMIGQKGMCIHPISEEYSSVFNRLCGELRSKRQCKPFLADSPGLRLRVLQDPLHVDELVSVARNHHVGEVPQPTCPWKIARETAGQADILVCDYNHLFNEDVRKASLDAMGLRMEDMILILDEAHNLPERIRMGLRKRLTSDLIQHAVYELEEHRESEQARLSRSGGESKVEQSGIARTRACEGALKRFRNRLTTWIREQKAAVRDAGDIGKEAEVRVEANLLLAMLRQELSGSISDEAVQLPDLIQQLFNVRVEIDADGDEETATFRLASVLSILARFAQSPAMCVVLTMKGDSSWLTTHLLDPSIVGREVFETVRGGILMSGTLTPPNMYGDTLGVPSERPIHAEEYPSPFMADRRPVLIASDVSTLWKRRGTENTRKMRRHLQALMQHTPGHVAVFCPSYKMLEEVISEGDWPGRFILMEESSWTKKRVESALEQMRSARLRGTKVLLAGVFGGRLSEGVDYSGNLLDAVACIGIPNAPKSVHNDALKSYIEGKHGKNKSWRYAVLQPAVNKILQGMGRAIRKAEDRAFILLLDDRLLTHTYKQCLPPTFIPFTAPDSNRTASQVKRFFKRHPDAASSED